MSDRHIREQHLQNEIRQLQETIRRLRQENQELKERLRSEADLHCQQPHPPADDEPVAGTA